jgi:epoxyqueuosine reductase QueG
VSRDYHLFFKALFNELIPALENAFPEHKFAGFTDHSPIDEIHASALAGLGIIGKNHLLITEKYSSYLFIGEIITDASLPSCASEIFHCINCGKCIEACPVCLNVDSCLSSLTQKKGELTDTEVQKIKIHGMAWGCDKCQEACPYTKNAIGIKFWNYFFF